jgi:hypothetical protein
MTLSVEQVTAHIRNCTYMGGAERDLVRIKRTGEVFTPTPLVLEILDQLPQALFEDPTKTFCDPSCGDGQFLGEILIKKMQHGSTFEQALSTIYGVDIMSDNVLLAQEKLLCGYEKFRHIVDTNIVHANSLIYHYRFGQPETIGSTLVFENKLDTTANTAILS